MAPTLRFIVSSGSKKKEPICACQNEAEASHAHKMWTEVSSSAPHFLQVGLLISPVTKRCLLKVLCLVRQVTTLHCVLLKDNNRVSVARIGSEHTPLALTLMDSTLCPHTTPHVLNDYIKKNIEL
jgi:hypothetical protein